MSVRVSSPRSLTEAQGPAGRPGPCLLHPAHPRDCVGASGLVALYLALAASSWKITGEHAVRVLGVE